MTLLGFKTVDEGERAVVTDHNGRVRVVDGPERLTLFRSSLRKLTRFIAGQGEYLKVKKKNGEVLHLPGPCSM